ncbi:MAG TPA: alkaline phosphatase family protein [Verrucomicrobiae bacterium]|nr:alkaline phosphatase family protein [Verrucomicrobiae bacterium]
MKDFDRTGDRQGKAGLNTHKGITRRQFIRRSTAAAGIAAASTLPQLAQAAVAVRRNKRLPLPQRSGIRHFVVVMMENRSFDHFLGWAPGADGRQAGLTYLDRSGLPQSTYPLAPDYQGCGHPDPDHSYQGGRVEYNSGACDGWLRAAANDNYAIGYYTQADLPFFASAVPAWTTLDRYFAAIMAGTYANRVYQHAAQTDRLDNSLLPISTLPTIWDRLAEHSLTGRYYFSDLPFVALWGAKYLPISRPIAAFYDDCAAGTLPHVSFVEPRMLAEHQGLSEDDHPYADIRRGQSFLNNVYEAVTSSPNWPETVMVINYDEWGGFFDHVPPPYGPIPPADAALGSDGLLGFRTPAMLISPWSPRGQVAHGVYNHTSVLKMIEWRWNLRPLTIRDATANNLAEALDFSRHNVSAPRFAVPPAPVLTPCIELPGLDEMTALAELAQRAGFAIP